MNPRFSPPAWEESGDIDDVVAVVKAAERCGYDWVSCSEHIAIPGEASSIRGGRYWDPFTTLGYLAAVTSEIGLLTHMAVLPYHHPLELVKRLGTLDLASRGRVICGVGVGSLEPEFAVLGHDFAGRGDRADDAMRAIRASWGQRIPEYHGTHFDFSGMIVEPSGLDRELKIWVGGRTRRSLRRAIELGDGWMPFGLLVPELTAMLDGVRERLAEQPIDLIFAPEPPVDAVGDPSGTLDLLGAYIPIGATGFSLRFHHESRSHYIEQMEATAGIIGQLAGS